jgi:hypothetical protein
MEQSMDHQDTAWVIAILDRTSQWRRSTLTCCLITLICNITTVDIQDQADSQQESQPSGACDGHMMLLILQYPGGYRQPNTQQAGVTKPFLSQAGDHTCERVIIVSRVTSTPL